MFGFNLKDENGDQLYKELTWEELEALVATMKEKGRNDPPFDYQKVVAEAQADQNTNKEMVGSMLRISGREAVSHPMKDYNKYVRLGLHALQLCYFEMEVPNLGRVGQLTVVDNYKFPLEKELVHGFVDMFFDYHGNRWRLMETPAHVAVVVEPVNLVF